MKIDGDMITFSSGRTADAARGVIGLSPNLEIHTGYDDIIYRFPYNAEIDGDDDLSRDEKIELAEFMILRWTELRNALVMESVG